jgi:Zn-dependent protease
LLRDCPNCGSELPLGALACPQCHALVYSIRLDQLAKDARALEAKRSFAQARELWEYSLTLLPHDSNQAAWVKDHIRALEAAQAGPQTSPESVPGSAKKPAQPTPNWVKKLGPFGPLALLLLKLKSVLFAVFKLKFLFSFLLFIWLYIGLFGWRYGLGISVAILVHEMGHFIDLKRRGLPAELPVFLPGLGAYVKWTGREVTRRQTAQISLAGPLAGWIAAAVCYLLYAQTRDPLWAALARTGAFLNTLNLIPIWIFDGGKAVSALAAPDRAALFALTLAIWLSTGEGIFVLVALGLAWRLYTKDKPQQSDWSTWAYYAALLIALGVILHVAPNTIANRSLIGR